MNKAHRLSLKLFAALVLLAVVVGIGYYFFFLDQNKPENTGAESAFGWKYPTVRFPTTGPGEVAYSSVRDPGGIPQGLPVRLKVPSIGVNSAIEDALITTDGRMDVPAGSRNVAWFALGPHPGQKGSAVIGGHFGISKGVPFVFYKLDKLKKGDKIYIVDDKGDTITFTVRSVSLFDRNADATEVFTSDDGLAHLNLITCEGIWNIVNGTYPQRRVVFADATPNEESVAINEPTSKPTPKTTPRQTTKPTPTVEPTRTNSPAATRTPAGTVEPTPSTSSTPIIAQSIKGLYATPVDGIVTSVLVISIVFVSFKLLVR